MRHLYKENKTETKEYEALVTEKESATKQFMIGIEMICNHGLKKGVEKVKNYY